jgi:hypothetical protein
LVVLVILVLRLQTTLFALLLIAKIAFFLAIAFFIYLVWRERRSEISDWPARARWTFYGAALLILADIGMYVVRGVPGYDLLAFVAVLAAGAFAMWRVWRDQHTYV